MRGLNGEGAGSVLSQINDDNMHAFDRKCRIGAVKAASRLFREDTGLLSLNTMPNSVYDPQTCLLTTIAAAEAVDFPINRIMFEMTEHEAIEDLDHFTKIVSSYKEMGFITAIDDFGAGSSGLTLFASVMPDIVKLDARLCAGIHKSRVQKVVVSNIVEMCDKLNIRVIAEGVEECAEVTTLMELGISLFQGYHFAKPAFDAVIGEANIPWDSVRC
ncbi:EAL domain-containing protein [Maricaulaceae bacterium EIL42A08]|nr:EAL domain-containing protein [Maricaulaceae bacterium EIL42A08]